MEKKIAPYIFTAPFIVIFVAFNAYPILFTIRLSFTSWHGAGDATWVGLGNYLYLLTNQYFWNSIVNSAVLWVLILPTQMAIALVLATLCNNAKIKARASYRLFFLVPFVTPLVAVAQIWRIAFDTRYGLVNQVLSYVGLGPVPWLTDAAWAKPTLAILFIWKTTGFIALILLSGLQSIDGQIYEAATIDGAGKLRQFVSVTIPLLKNVLVFAAVLQTIAVFQMFAEPFIVTQGGPYSSTTTAGLFLYGHISRADLGTGAANSFLLILIAGMFSAVSFASIRGSAR